MVDWDARALVGEAARRVIMLIHADGTGLAETTLDLHQADPLCDDVSWTG